MQISFQTVLSKYVARLNTSIQTCGNTSLSLMFRCDFLVSTKYKVVLAAASFRDSTAQFFKPA